MHHNLFLSNMTFRNVGRCFSISVTWRNLNHLRMHQVMPGFTSMSLHLCFCDVLMHARYYCSVFLASSLKNISLPSCRDCTVIRTEFCTVLLPISMIGDLSHYVGWFMIRHDISHQNRNLKIAANAAGKMRLTPKTCMPHPTPILSIEIIRTIVAHF
jgi:hypothetical protein